MKKLLIILIILLLIVSETYSQQREVSVYGKISYLSSQNIYVRFNSTEGIKIGDTLFINSSSKPQPAILVNYISSKSCSGKKIKDFNFKVGDKIIAFIEKNKNNIPINIVAVEKTKKSISPKKIKRISKRKIGDVSGRFSLSSYANLSSTKNSDFVRWRYTFSARSQNFRNSKFSFDSYISFNYRSTEWNYIKNNISNALKIYSLSVNYEFNKNINLSFGRKINRNVSNIGAVDGIQLEGKLNNFTAGLIVGSRPDYFNYTVNLNLFEFGGFVNHSVNLNFLSIQNSIAIFQQTNNSKIDRRFFYFQHSSSLINKIYLFLSTEVDLYKRENNIDKKDFSLTGLYTSLRYQPIRELSFNASYDSRKNVIYYETFQNYTDSLYENVTRQGVRFRVSIKPINRLFINFSYGFRFRSSDLKKSENYSGNISYSSIPFISGTFGLSYNHLSTSYLNGDIFGLRYSRDILPGVIYSSLNLRQINYLFFNGAPNLKQTVLGIDISWRIIKRLSLSFNFEGTFEKKFNYGRLFFNVTKRF